MAMRKAQIEAELEQNQSKRGEIRGKQKTGNKIVRKMSSMGNVCF